MVENKRGGFKEWEKDGKERDEALMEERERIELNGGMELCRGEDKFRYP